MAKKKDKKDNQSNQDLDFFDSLCVDIASETGGDLMSDLEDVAYRIDTGNLAINYSCSGKFVNGGIPGGKIIEAFGPEASGKTLIGSNCLSSAQRKGYWTILIDCEDSANAQFMEKISKIKLTRVLRYSPPSLEQAFRRIHATTLKIRQLEKDKKIEPRPIYIMFDSLTVPPCERELRENNLPVDYNLADWKKIVGRQEQPGERAKIISSELRKLQAVAGEQDLTVYLINQVRDNIGVMYGSPETIPGGKAVKFYASLRFRTSSKKKIEQKNIGKFSGINMQVKNVKNRGFRPFVQANDVKLYFDNGIDPIAGVLGCLIEGERVIMKSGGNFVVASEYLPEGVEEYKFKASKTENRMSLDVLLDCPKLVDAETREQVQEYVDFWGAGLKATESDMYEEVSLGNGMDDMEFGDYADDDSSLEE